MKRRIGLIITIALLFITVSVDAHMGLGKKDIAAYLDVISTRQMKTVTNPKNSAVGGEWTVIGLARYGTITEQYMNRYKANLKETLNSHNGNLSTLKYTEYARIVLALTALGEDVTKYEGYNLLKPLAEYDNVKKQGINGLIYALLALDSGNYEIPEPTESYDGTKTTRDIIKKELLQLENPNGGWSLSGRASDPDITAMTIQALSVYRDNDSKVRLAIDRGIKYLSAIQNSDGGFSSMNTPNCESTAQVLLAMTSVGIKQSDTHLVKNGNTVLDGVMQYYSNGAFKHVLNGKVNQYATDQAMYALVAYYRSLNDENDFYDMTDGIVKKKISKKSAGKVKKITKKYKEQSTGETGQTKKTTTIITESTTEDGEELKPQQAFKRMKPTEKPTTGETVSESVKSEKESKRKSDKGIYIGIGIVLLSAAGVLIYEKKKVQ